MVKEKLAVIIGRFQVPWLHEGHKYLIDYALEHYDDVWVLVGSTQAQPTSRNPLPYHTRYHMIKQEYPSVEVSMLRDHPSDLAWSEQVDNIVPSYGVLLASRDSFADHYHGSREVKIIDEADHTSGTALREMCASHIVINDDFRQGMINSVTNRYPQAHICVDVIPYIFSKRKILLGRKHGEFRWQCIGGFVDPSDESLKHAAHRELYEEVGGMPDDPHWYSALKVLDTAKIPDYRYNKDKDAAIFSVCFSYTLGEEFAVTAQDDIAEVAWFSIDHLPPIVPMHHEFIEAMVCKLLV